MASQVDLSPELQARVESIAARSNLSPSEVIADALENGHSLKWQEQFLEAVENGLSAAREGHFASDADIARIRNKYRPT